MRETDKQIKIGAEGEERTFLLHKMNALAGSALVKFCAEKFLPVYNDIQKSFAESSIDVSNLDAQALEAAKVAVAHERTEKVLTLIPQALSHLTDAELMDIEIRCLQTVEILKPAGWQPVMTNGHFGDEELEYDIATVLRLVYEVLAFNLSSFFGGGSLASFLNKQSSSQQNA